MRALETLTSAVNAIDIDETSFQDYLPSSSSPSISRRGIDTVRAYTPTPVPTPSGKAAVGDSQESSPVPSSQKRISHSATAVTQHFQYSILLWGQFDLVFQHAVEGKAIVKQFSIVVDSASSIFDFVSRSLGKLSKPNLASRSVSAALSSKLQPSSARYVARLSDGENAMSDQFEALCYGGSQHSLHISRRLQQLFVEIRVLKRECKGSFTMIQRRQTKLESEIQAAHETYQKNGAVNLPLFSSTSLTSKSQREIDVISRQWETAQVQHQLGNAHLLDQFQRIEQLRLSSLKRIMSDLHSALAEYCSHLKELQSSLLAIINGVNVASIMSDYSNRFTSEQSNRELFDHVGDGIEYTSVLIVSIENLLGIDEAHAGKLRKAGWNIRIQEEMPSMSKALASVSNFFQVWPQAIDRNTAIRRDDVAELRRWRDQWQSKLSIAVSKEQAEKKNCDGAASAYERARFEVAKAMQAVTHNQERLAKAESESSQPDNGISLMKFMKTPIDKQRVRLVESQTDLEAAQTHCNRLELEKTNAEQKYSTTLVAMRAFALELEQSRLYGMFTNMKKFAEHLLEGNKIVADALQSLWAAIREVDIQSDMTSWVGSIRAKLSIECPEIVLRNLERGAENADLRIPDRGDRLSVDQQSAKLSPATTAAVLDLAPTETSSTGASNQFCTGEADDNSLSDTTEDEFPRQGRIEIDGPKDSHLAPHPHHHLRQHKSGLISEASSISTLSD